MKIIHITDSHGTVKAPESRTDLYYVTFLRKLAELKYVIMATKADMIIHTGDLFHTSKVSNKFMGQVAEIIKTYNIPMYIVPGNHDIDGYTIDTIDQTSLGLLAKTGIVNLLTRDLPLRITEKQGNQSYTVAISGQEYYSSIDSGNTEDFEMQQDEADINILAAHAYIADTPQHPNIRHSLIKDIITDADIVLSGHYHRSFEAEAGGVSFYNPGSMLRVEMTDYNKNHVPQYGILDISLDKHGDVVYDYKFHKFKVAQPSTSVFDFNTKAAAKLHSVTLENFKNSIANTMSSIKPVTSFNQIIVDLCNQANGLSIAPKVLESTILGVYQKATASVSTEYEDNLQGYIQSHTRKIIKSVEIHNFQSHEDTFVEFDPGLNIIVGESNKGKTSIFRAIRWVISDRPLGTDFIMAGKKDCWVKINYSDGSFIKRYKTTTSSGTYEVHFYDDVDQDWKDLTFQGFSNNIPIEVANVHQMPKIFLTKDLETYLNVMDQLERPFLITESQAAKASAIGRITGTHIVDIAIKDLTSDNLALKKLNKNLEADLNQRELELSTLPNSILLNKLRCIVSSFAKNANALQNTITSGKAIDFKARQVESSIQYSKVLAKNYKDILKEKDQVLEADKLIFEVNSITKLYKEYEKINDTISNNNQKINRYKDTLSYDEKTMEAIGLKAEIEHIVSYIKDEEQLSNKVSDLNKTAKQTKAFSTNLRRLSNSAKNINNDIEKIIQILKEAESLKQKIAQKEEDIVTLKSDVDYHKAIIQETEKELKDYILSQGQCPFCGQGITKKHIHSIIDNASNN